MERFKALEFKGQLVGGVRAVMEFPNGYAASVICTPFSYGGPEGLYELAVMRDGEIVYDTPITDDVVGYCAEARIDELLGQIMDLPGLKIDRPGASLIDLERKLKR